MASKYAAAYDEVRTYRGLAIGGPLAGQIVEHHLPDLRSVDASTGEEFTYIHAGGIFSANGETDVHFWVGASIGTTNQAKQDYAIEQLIKAYEDAQCIPMDARMSRETTLQFLRSLDLIDIREDKRYLFRGKAVILDERVPPGEIWQTNAPMITQHGRFRTP